MQNPVLVPRSCRTLSIVIPVYNEADVLPVLWGRIRALVDRISPSSQVVFVDDGSSDGSLAFLLGLAEHDRRVGVISLSRNFGHQAAITAGLDCATSDATVVMDADLQDPPELIETMVTEYERGYDVVSAQRRSRRGETLFKRLSAYLFYRLLRGVSGDRLPSDVGDFRLMSRAALEAFHRMREQHRYVRGMVAWLGFPASRVFYERAERAAGRTKYSLIRMMALAWSGFTSFSALPVRAGFAVGMLLLVAAGLFSLRVLYVRFFVDEVVPGWTTVVLLQLFFFGLMFFYLGILGDYVGRIYEEGKGRPLYLVRLSRNVSDSNEPSRNLKRPIP